MMNKRNNDGYVLAYVMVVIAVVGLISASLMTSTMQVMQAQQTSIRHMQEKYKVQGVIERFIAEAETGCKSLSGDSGEDEFTSIESAEAAAYRDAKDRCEDLISHTTDEINADSSINLSSTQTGDSINVLAKTDNLTIDAALSTSLTINCSTTPVLDPTPGDLGNDDSNVIRGYTYYFHVNTFALTFDSYKITSTGGDS